MKKYSITNKKYFSASNKYLLILSSSFLLFVGIVPLQAQTILTNTSKNSKPIKKKQIGKMLGADISFLPELEYKGIKFSDNGQEKDAIQILKDHKINYVRLRIFNNPAADSGY